MAEQERELVELKDIVKTGIKERFAELRRMGIKTVMITGDNRPLRRKSLGFISLYKGWLRVIPSGFSSGQRQRWPF